MKKGDIVVVKAIVARQYSGPHFGWDPYQVPPRVPGNSRMFDPSDICGIYRKLTSFRGVVVGKSHINAGYGINNGWEEQASFELWKSVDAWVIEPADGIRYVKPVYVLEQDVEPIS